mmetsp:Transcript_25194/g.31763  ORF Transcript_25194/g.31763 Transcript_25194/m.31763 type:complete len:96 (-) Transcript_25194:196-483(-)
MILFYNCYCCYLCFKLDLQLQLQLQHLHPHLLKGQINKLINCMIRSSSNSTHGNILLRGMKAVNFIDLPHNNLHLIENNGFSDMAHAEVEITAND